jgi:hypothetical protein
MKFLHLSDFHITAVDAVNEPVRQRLRYIRDHYADHFFIISGDIIDNEGVVMPGTPLPVPGGDVSAILPTALISPPPPFGALAPHLTRAREALHKAYALLSLLPSGRMIFCAGNHDYGLWGNIYDDAFVQAFDEIIFTRLAPSVPFAVLSTPLAPRPFSAQYPIVYTIREGGVTTALTVLNSCGSAPTFPLAATGFVGGGQIDLARPPLLSPFDIPNLLGINQICVLHHHPFISNAFMELTDAAALLGQLSGNTDLLLFGHKHVEQRYEPHQVPNAQLRYGAIAAGSSRVESHAWQIVINQQNAWTLSRIPIV